MARVETTDGYEIPFNVFIDNADEYPDAAEGPCGIEIYGIAVDVDVYATDEEYFAAEPMMDKISMIPAGTFSPDGSDDPGSQSPHIIFSGTAAGVAWDPDADDGAPNCCITVETLGFSFDLFLRRDEPVNNGDIVHGVAWIYGDIVF